MFTGIITHVGTVESIDNMNGGDRRIVIASGMNEPIAIGASISCSGCCLTVVEQTGDYLAFDVSGETLSKTVLGMWQAGTKINLERSLKMGDEIGGHLVSGHVDGVAVIESVTPDQGSHRLKIRVPENFASFMAGKGSVALDGISLTVNEVEGDVFGVNIIPFTWERTTLGGKKAGDRLNFEVDLMARYVARQLSRS